MPLSTAAKAALCICPPALMAGTVATVPSVKRAVHHVTAERHVPKPIRRVAASTEARPKQVAAARPVDCDPGLGGVAPAVPLVTYAAPIPDEPASSSTSPTNSPGGTIGSSVPVVGAIGVIPTGGGGGGVTVPPGTTPPVTTPTDPGAGPVPEPSVWLMMIVGVGTLGAALRRRRIALAPAGHGMAKRTTLGGLLWSGSAAVEAGDMAATVAVKSAVASAAGKALLCVCPAAVVAGSVMTVPPLRQAVHAATVTPAVSAPLVAVAPLAAPPCTEAVTVPVAATALDGFPATVATAPTPAASTPAVAAPATAMAAAAPADKG